MEKEEIKLYDYIIKRILKEGNKEVCYGNVSDLGTYLIGFTEFLEAEESLMDEIAFPITIKASIELTLCYLSQYVFG